MSVDTIVVGSTHYAILAKSVQDPERNKRKVESIEGRGVPGGLYVECSKKVRDCQPLGTIFCLNARVSKKPGGAPYLCSLRKQELLTLEEWRSVYGEETSSVVELESEQPAISETLPDEVQAGREAINDAIRLVVDNTTSPNEALISNEIEALRPRERPRLMDLVRDAGIDVADWSDYAGGNARAASNPKYCYQWSFCIPARVVVVSIWHEQLRPEQGRVVVRDSLKATANFYAGVPGKAVWSKRAEEFDRAIALAASTGLPVRTIICDGVRRAKFDLEALASKVKTRGLDPVPWAVTSYDAISGEFVLARGAPPNHLKDQFSENAPVDSPTEMRSVAGDVFVRDPAVRRRALIRAGGRCEWCGSSGFATDDGSVFLETHHIIPLSEGGRDHWANVVALCANHHREAHFGSARTSMRERLLALMQDSPSPRAAI